MAKKLFGKATVQVDGRELIKKQDARFNPGGVNRNTVKGNEVYGFAEEAVEATIDINAFIDPTTDLETILAGDDVTILFTADSGQQYVMPHAWLVNPPEVSEGNDGGSMPLKYASAKSEAV